MILKLVLAGLVAFLLNVICVTIQYFYQSVHIGEDFFIHIGFPYDFYYFQPDFELHGSKMNHFIYDAVIWFGFSLLVVFVVNYFRKTPGSNEKEVIDTIE